MKDGGAAAGGTGNTITLDLWDTAGPENYANLRTMTFGMTVSKRLTRLKRLKRLSVLKGGLILKNTQKEALIRLVQLSSTLYGYWKHKQCGS